MTAKNQPSNRVAMFRHLCLAVNSEGLTATEIRTKIDMLPSNGQLGVLLRGELSSKRIRAERQDLDDGTKLVYFPTALGRKHYEEGKIDSFARERHLVAQGRAWEAQKPSKKSK